MHPSSEPRVTVGIPIGPGYDRRWLQEAWDSCNGQTIRVDVVVVDDMATAPGELPAYRLHDALGSVRNTVIFETPWNLGVAQSFNHCVALAPTDLVFMMGHDDVLAPDCVEWCLRVFDDAPDQWHAEHGYYYVPIEYMDTGEHQLLPNNCAMVHKQLWRDTGGFPPETGSGAPDAAFCSRAMKRAENGFPAVLVPVQADHPLYYYRRHPGTDTAKRGPWQGVILETRNILTDNFEPPRWGRTI